MTARYALTGDAVPLAIVPASIIETWQAYAQTSAIISQLLEQIEPLRQTEQMVSPGSLVIERGAYLVLTMLIAFDRQGGGMPRSPD